MAKRLIISMILFVSGFSVGVSFTMNSPTERTNDDLEATDVSVVTWAHAVNSREELEEALAGDVDFLEADISLGHLTGQEFGPPVAIMSHPPKNVSDITFERWLDIVITRSTGKGVKLDFKTIDVVKTALKILKKHEKKIDFPLWLNADILAGPIKSTKRPVPSDAFLDLCDSYFPNATLSLGWTTYFFENFSPHSWRYTWQHVRDMADVLRCVRTMRNLPSLTFPVRAVFTSRSIPQLQWLLDEFPDSTLTVWGSKTDPVTGDDLLKIRENFKVSQVYYDVHEPLLKSFSWRKNASKPPQGVSTDIYNWMPFDRGSPKVTCSSYTYVHNRTILFGNDIASAVLLNDVFQVSDSKRLQAEGFVTMYNPSDSELSEDDARVHQLSLVLVDVSLFSERPTKRFKTSADVDVIWNAMNRSILHVFKHDFRQGFSSCRYFKLDTQSEKAFQAWTIPCDELFDDITLVDVIKEKGKAEIPSNTRLVLPPGDVMFGITSYGPGHAVVHQMDIKGESPSATSVGGSVIGSRMFVLLLAVLSLMFLTL